MVAAFVSFLLSNFTLTLLVLGFVAAAISLWQRPRPLISSLVVEDLLAYFILFSIGISYLYNIVFHVFFGNMVAEFIGWAQSLFQAEVGFASLGFSYGAAGDQVYQMIAYNNFEPGNTRVIFYTDIGILLIGFVLLWLKHRWGHKPSAAEEVSREGATAT